MLFISYIFLALSLLFVVLFLLHRKSKFFVFRERSKLYLIIGVISYLFFIALAYQNHQAALANMKVMKKEIVALEKQNKNITVPIEITPHPEFSGKVGQKLVLTFTITNKSNIDIDKFTFYLENEELLKIATVNSTTPQAQIDKNSFIFGKLAAGSIQNYAIEITPTTAAVYQTQISFKSDQRFLEDNKKQIIKDNLKVTINP